MQAGCLPAALVGLALAVSLVVGFNVWTAQMYTVGMDSNLKMSLFAGIGLLALPALILLARRALRRKTHD